MSLLDEINKQRNPAQKWLQWSPKSGLWVYYDKDQGENVKMPDTIRFICLDQFHTVKGFHEESQSGIYSNEVKYIKTQPMTVKTFGGATLGVGLYSDIKDKVKAEGAKYAQSVYVALFNEEGKAQIANLMITGLNNQLENPAKNQPASPWVRLKKKYRGALFESTKGSKIKVAGSEYYQADFKEAPETPIEWFEESIRLAQELKAYTDPYQAANEPDKAQEVELDQAIPDEPPVAYTVEGMPF